jgi:nitrite reductase/ring-hydroxylating ferredoxin subunit
VTALPSSPSSLSRRTVIKHAGLAAAALASLSACTNYGSGGGTPSSAPTGGGATSTGAGATIKTADIPVGGGKIFADLSAVVTQPTAGEFKAFSSICTHQNCPVTEVTDTINCNCHGSKFSITDGAVLNPPATQALAAKQVSVEGEDLTIT